MNSIKIGFIGGGNMGEAMIAALTSAGEMSAQADERGGTLACLLADTHNVDEISNGEKSAAQNARKIEIAVCARSKNEILRQRYGARIFESEREIARRSDVIALATKPVCYEEILNLIAPELAGKILILLAPNFTLAQAREIAGDSVKIARAMPNVAAKIARSATALCYGENFEAKEREIVRAVAANFGEIYEIDEDKFAAFTAIAGSAPAYVFTFIEALADAGVRAGLARQLCYEAIAATVAGSAELMRKSGEHPAVLKDGVCSPAGTTIEALAALEAGGFRAAVMAAAQACVKKARD